MPNCTMCGVGVPDGQNSLCSMFYGDPGYGSDGYYQAEMDRCRLEAEAQAAMEMEWDAEMQDQEADERGRE